MFFEIIHYLYKETIITPILSLKERITPKDKNEFTKILKDNHEPKLAGHSGYNRTYKRIKEHYKCNLMKKDIKNYIRKCPFSN